MKRVSLWKALPFFFPPNFKNSRICKLDWVSFKFLIKNYIQLERNS